MLLDVRKKSILSLALATVYRPPGPYAEFLKEFADFLSDLLVNVDKAIIGWDFHIHVDNTNDSLWVRGCVYRFIKLLWGQVKCQWSHSSSKSLDLIISYGTNPTEIDIIMQSEDFTYHYMVTCTRHTAEICHVAPCYPPGRTILPTTIWRVQMQKPLSAILNFLLKWSFLSSLYI